MATRSSYSPRPEPHRRGIGGGPSLWLVVASAVAAGLLLGLAFGVLGRDGDGDNARASHTTTTPAGSASKPPVTDPSTTRPGTVGDREIRALALYYLRGGANSDARLFREFRSIEVVDRRPVLAAVSALFRVHPLDTDYDNPWPANSSVLATAKSGDTVIVNLARAATTGTASELVSRMAVQQLVYTATAADKGAQRVVLQVEGRQLTELWGHPVGTQPLSRAPRSGVLAPVWITAPVEGATVGGTVTVEGTADVFEGTVSYEVTDLGGEVVQHGTVQASAGTGTRGDWSVRLALQPGSYVLHFFYNSPEDGSVQGLDTKTIRVR
jgi:Immunoglobulin-like domain of bacterial spore germination/Sporulation and spore germination